MHDCDLFDYWSIVLKTGKKFLLSLSEFSYIEIIALVNEVLRGHFGENLSLL